MNGHHAHARQPRRRLDRSGNRVGDVAELEIEEYPLDQLRNAPDRFRSLRGEQLAADLGQTGTPTQLAKASNRLL